MFIFFMYIKNKKFLIILFSLFFLFGCSDTNPLVKVKNNTNKVISIYFKDNSCINCPSISFLNVEPFSETDYKSCSVKDYTFSVKVDGKEIITDVIFKPNHDENYVIIIDKDFKCDIKSLSK